MSSISHDWNLTSYVIKTCRLVPLRVDAVVALHFAHWTSEHVSCSMYVISRWVNLIYHSAMKCCGWSSLPSHHKQTASEFSRKLLRCSVCSLIKCSDDSIHVTLNKYNEWLNASEFSGIVLKTEVYTAILVSVWLPRDHNFPLCYTFERNLQQSMVNVLSHSFYICLQMHDIVKAVGNCSYNQLVEKIISCKQSDNSELAGEGECFLFALPVFRSAWLPSCLPPSPLSILH